MINFLYTLLVYNVIKDLKCNNREIVFTPDGGQLALDWANENSNGTLVVLILTGLTGNSNNNYISHYVNEAIKIKL